MRFTVKMSHPQNRTEQDIMRGIALRQGEGYTVGKVNVTIHQLSEYGLRQLEQELPRLIRDVHREDA